jgi:peptidoglycan/LPS O-acetylase OafA/YrhL
MFFYLLFPFIVMLYFRYGKSIKQGLLVLPVLIPLAIYFAPAGLRQDLFYINPLSRIADFFIGILLYHLYEKIKPAKLLRSMLTSTVAEVAAIGLFVLFFAFHSSVPQGYRYSCYYWIPVMLVIYVFAQQGGYLSKLLSNKILVLAGEISFSFYLLHHLVIKYISFINSKLFIIHYDYLLVAIIFIVSVVASYFSYYLVEIPSNRFIKGKYKALPLSSPAVNIA